MKEAVCNVIDNGKMSACSMSKLAFVRAPSCRAFCLLCQWTE